jgi:hypothetical protein
MAVANLYPPPSQGGRTAEIREEEVRFAPDSPLEERRFEPSVPGSERTEPFQENEAVIMARDGLKM